MYRAGSGSAPPATPPTASPTAASSTCAGTPRGTWQKTELPVAPGSSQRTKLVLDKYDNAYAVFPYGRIAGTSAASGYTDWKLLFDGSGLNAFGEVVIDELRVRADNVLSFMYQEKSTGTTPSALHVVDFKLPA